MRLHRAVLLVLFSVFQCLYLQGCVIPDTLLHAPPLAMNVPRIVKGQTTKDEVLKSFGVPDIEADGAQVRVSPDMALIRMYRAYRSVGYQNRERLEFDDLIGQKIKGSFPYSSIDDEHVAFVYIEHRISWGSSLASVPTPTTLPVGGVLETKQSFNRLLIFINKKTNVVDEFSFREEFDCAAFLTVCNLPPS